MAPQSDSFVVPGSARPGETGHHRAPFARNGLSEVRSGPMTLYDNFQTAVKRFADRPFAATRAAQPPHEYVYSTYGQIGKRVENFGSGLLGVYENASKTLKKTTKWNFVGIYSTNRTEWIITEHACNAHSLVTVPIYDTLGDGVLHYILNHAEIPVVVCSADRIGNLLKVARHAPGLKAIVSMDPLPSSVRAFAILKEWAADRGIALLEMGEIEKLGEKAPRKHTPPSPKDVATISYTSGTTGDPKGAMISHENFMNIAMSATRKEVLDISESDVHISYLPLAHVMERTIQNGVVFVGASMGFYRGDVNLLVEDIAALRPTIFFSVPRLYNRIYAKLHAATIGAPGLRGAMFRKAVADKRAVLQAGGGLKHALWDRLLFSKVAAVLGGRVRLMVTGSAPISGEVIDFLRICFSCDVFEGYGATESSGGGTLTKPGEFLSGHVGLPLSCNEIKLVDVPDMNYFATDKPFPRGEVCMRGKNVFLGYLKDEAKTKEAIDSEGWLHMGDIGMWNKQGDLVLIDRKKNIFKLAQGEYVAPEKIENTLLKCPLVAQSFVHGDSLQSVLVCVVVPNPETFLPWCKAHHIPADSFEKACANPEAVKGMLKEIEAISKENKLQGFEIVKALLLTAEPFSVENELLTPTFKLKRQQAAAYYRPQIEKMYEALTKGSVAGVSAAAKL